MKGKACLFVVTLVLVGLLAGGCGATVPQEEYDQAVADLAECQAEVETARSEAQSQVAEAEAHFTELQSDLDTTQQELDDLQTRVNEAAVASEMLSVFIDLALSGEEITDQAAMSAFMELSEVIQGTDDEVLQEKFGALILSENIEQDSIDLVVYLLEKITALTEE